MAPEEILEDIIQQANARQTGVNKFGNPQYMGCCPTHVDGKNGEPSLAISMGEKAPMIHCHAGCETRFVILAFGYAMSQLFPEWSKGERKRKKPKYDIEKADAVYQYQNENGEVVYQVCRFGKEFPFCRPNKGNPGQWIWNGQGIKRIIYRLPDVVNSDPSVPVYVCEGEKDCDRLASIGLVATCNPGGASKSPTQSKWKSAFSEPLAGRHVVILPDNDEPGRVHAEHIARSLVEHKAASIRILDLPGLNEKEDVSDWIDAGGTAKKLHELAKGCEPFNAKQPPKHLVICNHIETEDGKLAIPMKEIIERIESVTDGWPCRVGNVLFVPTEEAGGINWLERPSSLFGWLASKQDGYTPDFAQGSAMINKNEVFESLRMRAKRYDHVELFPHEPPIPGCYYACETPSNPTSGRLMELIEMFQPKTPADKQLILSMFLTMFWGGLGGKRPAFIVTGEGRGSGKSVLIYSAARLCGGTMDISAGDEADKIKARLLSPEGMRKRVVIIDNVKSHRFSWPDLEALVTAEVVSGRRDYMGEQSRPNNITYTITLNGPSLSTDITHRAIMIQLARPKYKSDWDQIINDFITKHYQSIQSDILNILRGPKQEITEHIRWGSWGSEVIGRCGIPDGISVDELMQTIRSRQAEADVEADDGGLIEEKIKERLEEEGYDTDYDRIFIPTKVVAGWINEATGERYKVAAAGRVLAQKVSEGEITHISKNPTHKRGKGFVWNGPFAGSEDRVKLDLETRLDNRPYFR